MYLSVGGNNFTSITDGKQREGEGEGMECGARYKYILELDATKD